MLECIMQNNRPKLLLVDDEPDILETLVLILEKDGYTIETAENGLVALDKINNTTYDLVVCDYVMPKMDGISLLKKIREQNNLIPFIFFSGNANDEHSKRMMELGAMALVSKSEIFKLPSIVKRSIMHGKGIKNLADKHSEESDEFVKILNSTKS
jgi:CheY-like chemotaxis protein